MEHKRRLAVFISFFLAAALCLFTSLSGESDALFSSSALCRESLSRRGITVPERLFSLGALPSGYRVDRAREEEARKLFFCLTSSVLYPTPEDKALVRDGAVLRLYEDLGFVYRTPGVPDVLLSEAKRLLETFPAGEAKAPEELSFSACRGVHRLGAYTLYDCTLLESKGVKSECRAIFAYREETLVSAVGALAFSALSPVPGEKILPAELGAFLEDGVTLTSGEVFYAKVRDGFALALSGVTAGGEEIGRITSGE